MIHSHTHTKFRILRTLYVSTPLCLFLTISNNKQTNRFKWNSFSYRWKLSFLQFSTHFSRSWQYGLIAELNSRIPVRFLESTKLHFVRTHALERKCHAEDQVFWNLPLHIIAEKRNVLSWKWIITVLGSTTWSESLHRNTFFCLYFILVYVRFSAVSRCRIDFYLAESLFEGFPHRTVVIPRTEWNHGANAWKCLTYSSAS